MHKYNNVESCRWMMIPIAQCSNDLQPTMEVSLPCKAGWMAAEVRGVGDSCIGIICSVPEGPGFIGLNSETIWSARWTTYYLRPTWRFTTNLYLAIQMQLLDNQFCVNARECRSRHEIAQTQYQLHNVILAIGRTKRRCECKLILASLMIN